MFWALGLVVWGLGVKAKRQELALDSQDATLWTLQGNDVLLNCDRSYNRNLRPFWQERLPDGQTTTLYASTQRALVGFFSGRITLELKNVSQALNGSSYQCYIPSSWPFRSGWLTILVGDKLSFTCENKSAAACTKIGQTLEKPCEFRSGFPLPSVTVEKLGAQSAARVPLVDLDKLTFNAVRLEDRGVYRVRAKNVLEETIVDVAIRPEIDICMAPVPGRLSIHDPVDCHRTTFINYTVTGIPTPEIRWRPRLKGRTVVERTILTKASNRITSIATSTMELHDVERSDGDVRFCIDADNGVSPLSSTCFRINITCDFDAPQIFLNDQTSNSLTFLIPDERDDENRLRATEYIVSYWRTTNANESRTIAYDKRPDAPTYVQITALEPDTLYTIELTARNGRYLSESFVGDFSTLRTDDCVPRLRLTELPQARDVLRANWDYVCDGSEPLKRVASYAIDYECNECDVVEYRVRLRRDQNQYDFRNLRLNVDYNFTLTVATRTGVGKKSDTVTRRISVDKTQPTSAPDVNDMTGIIFAFVTLGVLLAASWFAIIRRLVKKHWGTKSSSHSGNPELKLNRLYEARGSLLESQEGEKTEFLESEYIQVA
ncbi:neural cell adhesion molecule 1-A-like isoform X2 [Oscarella lobularis]|uniref:neural cell adhesion molecule 1-A-like isoform X2 n=1 Tax=Oscarella lobularis TaxID=121494 RepID=UPI003313430C